MGDAQENWVTQTADVIALKNTSSAEGQRFGEWGINGYLHKHSKKRLLCGFKLLPFPLLKISYLESFFSVRVGDTFTNGDFPCECNFFFLQKANLYSIFRASVTFEVFKKITSLK